MRRRQFEKQPPRPRAVELTAEEESLRFEPETLISDEEWERMLDLIAAVEASAREGEYSIDWDAHATNVVLAIVCSPERRDEVVVSNDVIARYNHLIASGEKESTARTITILAKRLLRPNSENTTTPFLYRREKDIFWDPEYGGNDFDILATQIQLVQPGIFHRLEVEKSVTKRLLTQLEATDDPERIAAIAAAVRITNPGEKDLLGAELLNRIEDQTQAARSSEHIRDLFDLAFYKRIIGATKFQIQPNGELIQQFPTRPVEQPTPLPDRYA